MQDLYLSFIHNLKFNDATVLQRVSDRRSDSHCTKSRNLDLLPIIVVPRNTSSYIAGEQLCKLPIVYHARSQTHVAEPTSFHNSSAKRLIIPRNVSRSSSPAAKDEQKRATRGMYELSVPIPAAVPHVPHSLSNRHP